MEVSYTITRCLEENSHVWSHAWLCVATVDTDYRKESFFASGSSRDDAKKKAISKIFSNPKVLNLLARIERIKIEESENTTRDDDIAEYSDSHVGREDSPRRKLTEKGKEILDEDRSQFFPRRVCK